MNTHKIKHFYFNKYILKNFTRLRCYHLSYNYKYKALWFRNNKVASRTIHQHFKENDDNGSYLFASAMPYRPQDFKEYFKFAFVREPKDRLISAWKNQVIKNNVYNFNKEDRLKMKSFNLFVNWLSSQDICSTDVHFRMQRELIDLNNIDFLGRFENFNSDFNYVCETIGMPIKKLHAKNKSSEKDPLISDEISDKINHIYRMDYNLFYSHLI